MGCNSILEDTIGYENSIAIVIAALLTLNAEFLLVGGASRGVRHGRVCGREGHASHLRQVQRGHLLWACAVGQVHLETR